MQVFFALFNSTLTNEALAEYMQNYIKKYSFENIGMWYIQ